MRQRWENLTFLHWDYPVAAVERLLPCGLRVEPWEGRAWVGLLAFHMRVRPPVGPSVPGLTTFAETNLRTYVIGPDGRSGVWFFSLDASNAPAVVTARVLYGLPYFFAAMRIHQDDDRISYRSRRIGLHQRGVGHDIAVAPGETFPPGELAQVDHYLTARFMLWAAHLGRVLSVAAEHPPWVLRRARLLHVHETLLGVAGLPEPSSDPVLHYSDGVDVRIGKAEVLGRRSPGGI
jgi:hypothetical protein